MSEENKELAVRGKNEVATFESGAWGAGQEVTQEDLVIGKIMIMQPQSKAVIKRINEQGELRGTSDNKLYAPAGGALEVVIFSQDKVWTVYENKKWKETFAWTPANAKLDWHEQNGNVEIQRQKAFNFYALPMDGSYNTTLPVIVRMKSTSYKTGKNLSTFFAKLAREGFPSAKYTIKLYVNQEENKDGVFYVWDFAVGRETTKEEQAVAYKWYKEMKQAQFITDESDESGEADARVASGKGPVGNEDVDFI